MDGQVLGQRFVATSGGTTPSSRHAILSVFSAFAITFVLIYSLSQASWTDFGAEPVVGTKSSAQIGPSEDSALYDDQCLLRISDGNWEISTDGCPAPSRGVLSHCDNSTGLPRRWASRAPADCLPSSLVQADVAAMFKDKKVAFVGDSHLRKLYNFMIEFLSDDQITVAPASDKKEHKDFATTVEPTGTRLEFYWRAEIRSTAAIINEFLDLDGGGGNKDTSERRLPDLIVCDASAHQAKWARDYDAFVGELPTLVEAVMNYHERFPRSPIVWMISPPFREVYDPSNPETQYFYSLRKFNDALWDAGLFAPKGPVVPIDMYRIAEGCVDYCYRDNTHVLPSVNVLLFQMITGAYRRYVSD